MKKKIGDLTLREFIDVLTDCASEKTRKCKYCLFQDIECNNGHLSNFNLTNIDLTQEIEVDEE